MNKMAKNSKRIAVAVTIAAVVSGANFAQATTFSIEGDTGLLDPGASNGTLEIIVDNSGDETTFRNGGIAIALQSSQPGIIEFTDAEVLNPEIPIAGDRWSGVSVSDITPDSIGDLFAASVNTPALNPAASDAGDNRFLFATVNYNVLGAGATNLSLSTSSRPDPLIFEGDDVSGSVEFAGATVNTIPEPTTLLLSSIGLVGLALRRRRLV